MNKNLNIFLLCLIILVFIVALTACDAEDEIFVNNTTHTSAESEISSTSEATHVHSFGEWEILSEPDCTHTGEEERTCECGESECRVISAVGHTPGEWITDNSPSCKENGLKHRICLVCNQTVATNVIQKLNTHVYDDGICTFCGLREQSEGLEFELRGSSYAMTGLGTCSDSVIVIPDTYLGKPVTVIATNAITGGENKVNKIFVPDSVTSVESSAIYCARFCEIYIGKNARIAEMGIEVNTAAEICYASSVPYNSNMFSGMGKNIISVYTPSQTSNIEETTEGYLFLTVGSKIYLVEYRGNGGDITLPESFGGKSYNIVSLVFADAKINKLTFGTGVASIGEAAFIGSTVSEIIWSSNITEIPGYCFNGCVNLTSLTIPDTVTTIGPQAFDGSGITTLTIGKNVSFINVFAFAQCTSLDTLYFNAKDCDVYSYSLGAPQHVFIGSDVIKIPNDFMSYNKMLKTVTFDNNSKCQTIGTRAFNKTNITEICIPASVMTIETYAFNECKTLKNVVFSATNCTNANTAFYDCSAVDLIISKNVTRLPSYLFIKVTLKSITFEEGSVCKFIEPKVTSDSPKNVYIPATVEQFDCFRNAENLIIDENNPYFIIKDSCLIDIERKALIYVRSVDFKIPADGSVTTIAAGSFVRSDIISVIVPDSILKIESGAFRCLGLKSISLPFIGESRESNMYLAYIFGTESYYGAASIDIQQFGTSIPTRFYIPPALNTVIFRGDKLENHLIGMSMITTFGISENVGSISQKALSYCPNIANIYFGGTEESWNALKSSGWLDYIRASANIYLNEELT